MKTLYLIRHAQSLANAGGESLPERDIPLSALGQQQARDLLCRLPENAAHVYTSEMRRTHETAAPFCEQRHIAPMILPCLNEFSYLSIDLIRGITGEERRPLGLAYWQRANIHERTGQGADTFAEFNQRVDDFLVLWHTLPDNSLLFGHGIWIAMLAWKLLGFQVISSDEIRQFRAFQLALPMPNTAVWKLSGNDVQDLKLTFQAA